MDEEKKYFGNSDYNYSEKLKEYDAYNDVLPIGYTEGCLRRLDKDAGRMVLNPLPHFGYVITENRFRDGVEEAIHAYHQDLLVQVLANVYDDKDAKNADYSNFNKYKELELMERFYPSSYNWLVSKSGKGPAANGVCDDPVDKTNMEKKLYSSDPKERAACFQIDLETGKFLG